jgi:hypothetical protein
LINSLICYLLHEIKRSKKLSLYIDMSCKAYVDVMSLNKYTLFEIWYLKVTYYMYIICNKNNFKNDYTGNLYYRFAFNFKSNWHIHLHVQCCVIVVNIKYNVISGDFECPQNTVKCPNSYCISLRFVCDGRFQCPGGQDEHNCSKYC